MLDRLQFERAAAKEKRLGRIGSWVAVFAIYLTGAGSTLRAGDDVASNAGPPSPYTNFATLPDSAKSALILQLVCTNRM